MEILNLFCQFEFAEKGEGLPNLDWLLEVTRRIDIIQSFFFCENSS